MALVDNEAASKKLRPALERSEGLK